ncbi:hypothetical protein CTheo_1347 [Ceratobasidium theobromae]|uniref:DUF6589 domain-containing protein n=1 Tax=Ceratobasidium theobromae TaxID=1582974 RepID=A0A5N5QUG4_9AGAM|nr:hypothetical protein CTheo_1347 [Ceratobasidium theobromae]
MVTFKSPRAANLMITRQKLHTISQVLWDNDVKLSELFCVYISGFVESQELTGHAYALQQELCSDVALNQITRTLLTTRQTKDIITKIARNIVVRSYIQELGQLLLPSAGFHANVAHAVPSQFHNFSSMKLANKFEEICPTLWKLFGVLLNGTSVHNAAIEANNRGDYLTEITYRDGDDKPNLRRPRASQAMDFVLEEFDDMPDEDWGRWLEDMGSSDEDERAATEELPQHHTLSGWDFKVGAPWRKPEGNASDRALERSHVRRIGMFSICMMNSNIRCNALQAIFGLFLHSTNTPEKVVELFSHIGLAISPSSINRMVDSMSREAMAALKNELPGLLVALGYDNLEIRFDTEQPTATHGGKLVSMTTATCLPLRPGVKKSDLEVSAILWARSELNSDRTLPPRSVESLYAWHVRNMLLSDDVETISPSLKETFRRESLGFPIARSSIAHPKTIQRNLRTMNISVSTHSGNGAAIDNMLQQGGASDADLETHIILFHGDLGTGDHIHSLQGSRAIEDTARDRLQFPIFVPGWFHTRMAMADSIWRLWIEPDKPSPAHPTHPHSIFQLCCLLRPQEVGKISNNPGFRRTHSLIEHTTLATISDAWRLLVKAKFGVELEEWKPTWHEVMAMSHELVKEYVAGIAYEPTKRSNSNGDMVYDQLRLFN